MIGSPQEIPGTLTIKNTEPIVRLQKIFSFADGETINLHGAKIELRGGVNINKEKEGTPIETAGKGKKQTNLVDFLQEDTSIQAILEEAILLGTLKPDQLRAVKLPIASVTTGTRVPQSLDLSKPLTNIQKAEAIGLVLQNIGKGKLIEKIVGTMNQKIKRTGEWSSSPFMQMDYLNALTAAGGQSLLNAVREADYRPYQINGKDKTRRKVSSSVNPLQSEGIRREIAEVTEDQGMNVFEPVKKVVEGIKGKDTVPELQESPSVDLKAAQIMFNLFLPPSELLAMNRLELQIGRETDLGKKENLRHELVKKRQMNYIALLQANGVKGYEANGPVVRELIEKEVFKVEEVNSMQEDMVKRVKKIMGRKGLHESSLHDANIESLVQTFSENYTTKKKNQTVPEGVRNAFSTIEISRDAITKLEVKFRQEKFPESELTRMAYEALWKQFSGALKVSGLEVAHKKSETPQEKADTEEALKLFFLDRVRTELGMTERKIKFESGFKDPSDVRLFDVEDWGIKGLDLLFRRTQSTQVYRDVGDYDEKMRTLLQKIASQEEPSEEKSATLVQETKRSKKLDKKTEELRKEVEKNLPKTPPVKELNKKQVDDLSKALGEIISAQLKIGQEPSSILLNAVSSLVTAENPEFHLSSDLLFRIVLGEAVRTPAGKVVIDELLPQILDKLKGQPQRLEAILGVLDKQQQNGETPDDVAAKLIALYHKYEPAIETQAAVPEPPAAPPAEPGYEVLEAQLRAQLEKASVPPLTTAPAVAEAPAAAPAEPGYTAQRVDANKIVVYRPGKAPLTIPIGDLTNILSKVNSESAKNPGNEEYKKNIAALEALQLAELQAKLSKKVDVSSPAASSTAPATAATGAPLSFHPSEPPVNFPIRTPRATAASAAAPFSARVASGTSAAVEAAGAAAPLPEARSLTVTHQVLEVGRNENGDIVIKQPEDRNDPTTGRVLPDGASEFVFGPKNINHIIDSAQFVLDGILRLNPSSDTSRNMRAYNQGLIVNALYEYKKAEVAQSLAPHLAALGINENQVSSEVITRTRPDGTKHRVVVFNVPNSVSVSFSSETSEQLRKLNEAATAAQGVEVHVAQLDLTPAERAEGEAPFDLQLQLPAEVGTLVAKDGATGIIGIGSVGTVRLEGTAKIKLTRGGADRGSVKAIQMGSENLLVVSQELAKDLDGQEIRLDLPSNQSEFFGYNEPGSYSIETSTGNIMYVKRAPTVVGGTPPPPPPPPQQPTSPAPSQPSTSGAAASFSASPLPKSAAVVTPGLAASRAGNAVTQPTPEELNALDWLDGLAASSAGRQAPAPPAPDEASPVNLPDWLRSPASPAAPQPPTSPSQPVAAEAAVDVPPRAEATGTPLDVNSGENSLIDNNDHRGTNRGAINFMGSSQGTVDLNMKVVHTNDFSSPFIRRNEEDVYVWKSSSPTISENNGPVTVYDKASLYVVDNADSIIIFEKDALLFVSADDKKGRIRYLSNSSESQVFAVGDLPSVDNLSSHRGYVEKYGRKFVVIASKNSEGQTAYAVFESRKVDGSDTFVFVDGRRDAKDSQQSVLLDRLQAKTSLNFTTNEIEKAEAVVAAAAAPGEFDPTPQQGGDLSYLNDLGSPPAADATPSQPPRPSRTQAVSDLIDTGAHKAEAGVNAGLRRAKTGFERVRGAVKSRLSRRGQSSAEASADSTPAVLSLRREDLDAMGLTPERTQQLDQDVQQLVDDLSSGNSSLINRARDTISEQVNNLTFRLKERSINDHEKAEISYVLARLILHPTGNLPLEAQIGLEYVKDSIAQDLFPLRLNETQADIQTIAENPLICDALAHIIQRDISDLSTESFGNFGLTPNECAQGTRVRIITNLTDLAGQDDGLKRGVRSLLESQPQVTDALLSYFRDQLSGEHPSIFGQGPMNNVIRLFDAVDMKPVYVEDPKQVAQLLGSTDDTEINIGLRSATNILLLDNNQRSVNNDLLLEINQQNLDRKDALVTELDKLFRKAYKEGWLPHLLLEVTDNQEVATQFYQALNTYELDYMLRDKSIDMRAYLPLSKRGLMPFGSHYPDLDRFISSLRDDLDFKNFESIVVGFNSLADFEKALSNMIIEKQVTEGIYDTKAVFNNLMMLNPAEIYSLSQAQAQEYSQLQFNILSDINAALDDTNRDGIENTENFIDRSGVADAIKVYKRRYNQANRKGFNINPFSKEFPELEKFLKEEEKSAKETHSSMAGTRPKEE